MAPPFGHAYNVILVILTVDRQVKPMVLLDGPMGTELSRRGVETPGPGWSAHAIETSPDVVASIHREYALAGATVHTANTFRTHRRALGSEWGRWARRAVALVRASVPGGCRVAGSMGPVRDCYRPDLSPGAGSREEHRELAELLAGEGVDLLICETFASPVEAVVAVEEAVRTGVPAWVSMTAGPDANLITPAAMRDAARACANAGAAAVLVNCTPATKTLAYVERLEGLGIPFGAYANAGRPEDGVGWNADASAGARAYLELARHWVDAGATILGGCCGTRAEHIAELARIWADGSADYRTSFTKTRP
jgi:S-methylmethionine-dependent homocysteine/selenocysteine methylase